LREMNLKFATAHLQLNLMSRRVPFLAIPPERLADPLARRSRHLAARNEPGWE
jgi:hypothetical protein